jgi:hypothetical protein
MGLGADAIAMNESDDAHFAPLRSGSLTKFRWFRATLQKCHSTLCRMHDMLTEERSRIRVITGRKSLTLDARAALAAAVIVLVRLHAGAGVASD